MLPSTYIWLILPSLFEQHYKSFGHMAGVYIHIPFCRKACHYCNFHFSTSTQLQEGFVNALLQEIDLQKSYLSEPVSTIYFGGGTPSILPSANIKNIISRLQKNFTIKIMLKLL
jgi:oxygen-independent coproporphyrinogen-3 oxidase